MRKPIRASWSSDLGRGSPPHLLGETLRQSAKINIASIPYRGGDQARTDLLGGRVHINIAPVASLLPLIQDGKVRPLAFTGPERSPDLPHVPSSTSACLGSTDMKPHDGSKSPTGENLSFSSL